MGSATKTVGSSSDAAGLRLPLHEYAAKAGLTEDALLAVRAWLTEHLVADEFARLGEGGHTQTRVPLRRVFVDLPVTVTPVAESSHADRALFLESLFAEKPFALQDLCGRTLQDVAEVVESLAYRRPVGRVLLIGGPGQGKSTLGQLACQVHRANLLRRYNEVLDPHANSVLEQFDAAGSDGIPRPKYSLLPLRVILPDAATWLARAVEAQDGGTIPALLRFLVAQPSAQKAKLDAQTLWALLAHMAPLLVLDGFDEVGAKDDRDRIVAAARELVTGLAERGARAQIVATTRPQGYAGELERISIPLLTRYLAPLQPDEALAYAKKLVHAKISGADRRARMLERIGKAAEDRATSYLLRTPLQVTIVAALVEQMGHPPSERWKLFFSYFDFTYRREIERGTYASELLREHRPVIEDIHARVALLLQVEGESGGGAAARLSRERLQGVIDEVLGEEEIDPERRSRLVQQLADAAEYRLVFLVEPEPGAIGFEIRSLQEFMAAWALTHDQDAATIRERLLQISKPPLFRNVALFMASRFYSDRLALRDTLPDTICGALDEDPSDSAARVTKAGALLALEILEEGSALNQPKRARALLQRAATLLELPASSEHARLAHVASGDIAGVLRDTLRDRLKLGSPAARAGAWACVMEATNSGAPWASELADAIWVTLGQPAEVLVACRDATVSLGSWLSSKIKERPAAFSPDLVGSQYLGPTIERPLSWVDALPHLRNRTGTVRYDVHREKAFAALAEMPDPPPAWQPWVAVGAFEKEPSSASLANALTRIADVMPPAKWSSFYRCCWWPLTACLRASAVPDDLRRLARVLEAGQLGDASLWKTAQSAWATTRSFDQLVGQVTSELPWDVARLADAPPLMALDFWRGDYPRSKRASLFRYAADTFKAASSPAVRAHLAEMCLNLIDDVEAKTLNIDELRAWTQECPVAILPPRLPNAAAVWIDIVDALGRRGLPIRYTPSNDPRLRSMLSAFIAEPARVGLMRWLWRAGMNGRLSASPSALQKLATILTSEAYGTPASRADAALLRIVIGAVSPQDVPQLLNDIVAGDVMPWFLRSLDSLDLADSLHEALLKGALDATRAQPFQPQIIAGLRGILRSRRSDLSTPATWDRLRLPRPYPAKPAAVPRQTAIPDTPVVLERLRVQNLRGLADIDLTFTTPSPGHGQWTVLIGPNGVGKTTLLRALVLALRNLGDPKIWPKGVFSTPWCSTSGPGTAQFEVRVRGDRSFETRIRSNGSEIFTQSPARDAARPFPVFAYGCRRGSALGGVAREVDVGEDDGPEVATLFEEGAPLVHAETWLKIWDGDAQKTDDARALFELVTHALVSLLDVQSVEVRDREVWVSDPKVGGTVLFRALSDGYVTTAGWFLDLVVRWIELARRHNVSLTDNFLDRMTGLVLIDELDLHLHPQWQVEVISRVRKLLRQMSFVVTTHNPLTLVGAQPEEIWILAEDNGRIGASRGTEAPMLLTGGQIFSRYFGIRDVYPDELGKKLSRYGFLSGYSERDDAEQTELEELRATLRASGVDPGWEEVPRLRSAPMAASRSRPEARPRRTRS
jgi:hypothetical protein